MANNIHTLSGPLSQTTQIARQETQRKTRVHTLRDLDREQRDGENLSLEELAQKVELVETEVRRRSEVFEIAQTVVANLSNPEETAKRRKIAEESEQVLRESDDQLARSRKMISDLDAEIELARVSIARTEDLLPTSTFLDLVGRFPSKASEWARGIVSSLFGNPELPS